MPSQRWRDDVATVLVQPPPHLQLEQHRFTLHTEAYVDDCMCVGAGDAEKRTIVSKSTEKRGERTERRALWYNMMCVYASCKEREREGSRLLALLVCVQQEASGNAPSHDGDAGRG